MQREKQQLLCPFSPLVLHGTAGSRATERERDGGREGWMGGKKNVNEREKRQHKKSQTTLMRESGERRRAGGAD